MKRILAISFALCVLSAVAYAQWMPQGGSDQDRKQGADRINAAKVAFFTQQLDLSVAEAEKFWPIYNEYNKEVEQARAGIRGAMMKMNDPNKKADELKAALKEYTDSQKKEAQLTENYINKLLRVMPVEKVAKVFTTEDMFRMQLLYQFRQGGPGGAGAPGAPGQSGNAPGSNNGNRNPWQRGGNSTKQQ